MLLILLLIVVIIVAYGNYSTKKKQEEVQKNAKPIIGYDTQTGIPLYEGEKVIGYNTQTGYPIIEGREQPQQKTPIDKSKISNSILMFVGAGLIVFGTLVFLGSSWDNIPNIIKPLILVFIQLVFYASYRICTDKLDIPKTGKVFKFLAFIFLPIILISFSCFKLVGERLSVDGDLEGLYFAISFAISDAVFKIYAKAKDDIAIRRGSYFLEILALLSFDELIGIDYSFLILLAIYTVVISILSKTEFLHKKSYGTLNEVTSYVIMGITFLATLGDERFGFYVPFVIYAIYFFIMYFMEEQEEFQIKNLALFFINYTLAISYVNSLSIPKYFVYLLFVIPVLLFAKLTKKEFIQRILQYVVYGATTLVLVANLFNLNNGLYDTLTFEIGVIIYALLFVLFENNARPIYKITGYAAFNILLMNICSNMDAKDLIKYVPMVTATLIYLLEKVVDALQDVTSKHIVPILLIIQAVIFTFDVQNYLLLLPLILIVLYTKFEHVDEGYIIAPAICSISLFFNEGTPLNIGVCSVLVLVYSILSALKFKINIYTLVSIASIVIGLPSLHASAYVVFLTLLVWSIIHYIAYDENKKLFILTGIVSALGLYIKGLYDLDVAYISIYFLGIYLALIGTTRLVFKEGKDVRTALECIAFAILSFLALIIINEPIDGIIMIIIFFMLTILSFVNKYKALLYCSIVSMIVYIIKQTFEFWDSIPIYIYVLLIGIALIFFAMFDEKLNIKQKKEEKEEQKNEEKE